MQDMQILKGRKCAVDYVERFQSFSCNKFANLFRSDVIIHSFLLCIF